MREEGIVTATEDGIATVLIKRKSACGDNCATCKATCSAGERSVAAKNDLGAKIGDRVSVEMDTGKILKTAFLVYILPLFVFFASYMIGDKFFNNQEIAMCTALIPAALVFCVLMIYDRKKKDAYIPRIVEII